jgi:undecaprenyl-diphosphatase
MDVTLALQAVFLGIIEGLTEFLPVSSTGHLILAGDLLGFRTSAASSVFEVVIQLGAILAVVAGFFPRLVRVAFTIHDDPGSQRFATAVLLAFLPSAVVGAFAHDFIKDVLFSPWVVSVALIVGGVVLIVIEKYLPTPRVFEVEAFSAPLALKIGLFQVVSMIPGVSRAGATIIGALTLGVERRAAAEFSFFLAIPTMLGASTLDLYKNREALTMNDAGMIAIGFVAAFLSAMVVVRTFVGFVGRHGFAPFGWYRIAVGSLMLALLAARG